MKIKFKFTIGLFIILVTLGLGLNILIRQVLIENMEAGISNSLNEVIKSTGEHIKYRLIADSMAITQESLKEEVPYIIKYISLNYACGSEISDMKGNVIQSEGNVGFDGVVKEGIKEAKEGKAVVNLKYTSNGVQGILIYPIYVDSSYLGIITINKSYNEIFSSYKQTYIFITLIEFSVFFVIFILAYIMTSKITKPITALTEAIIQVGEGKYDVEIKGNNKDEVGVLSKELINMRNKIKQQIETINLEKEKVERLEKVRTGFFNSVTHELKTPLTAISGYAEMLKEELVEDKEFNKRAIERIYSESERLHSLVLELIDVSKGISFVDEEKKPIEMDRMLNDICDDMNIKAKKYSIEIHRNIKAGSIFGAVNRIKALLINIIDNALKYSINGESIVVIAYTEEAYYKVEIINKAEPIPKSIYNEIFQPFVKLDKAGEERSRGLGLYICSEIIQDHNGEIKIENGEKIIVKIRIPSFSNNLETNS